MSLTPRVLMVAGASRPDDRLSRVMARVGQSVVAAGGVAVELPLWAIDLPLMQADDASQAQLPAVARVRAEAAQADAFVIGTPEYHGNMSGALKNWFDFLYGELAGKLAAVVATTGGGSGDLSITGVKRTFAWCHGFTLPFHCAANRAAFVDGELRDARVLDRLDRIGHDVVRYARVLRPAFEAARGELGVAGGVAGLHPKVKP